MSQSMSFEVVSPPTGNWWNLLVGETDDAPRPEPTFRVEYEYLVPTLRGAPVKHRRLTGKAYRIARRAYARDRRAWLRAGSPMRAVRVVIPNARLVR